MANPYYRDYADFLSGYFPRKMQKLAVNARLSCPNRDGTIGHGGCIYCNNRSFSPSYTCGADGVTAQLDKGMRFFSRKYPDMGYLAYFQSYTNTHSSRDELLSLYDEALSVEGIGGLVIGTRPDCVSRPLLEEVALRHRHRWAMMEYGAETACDATLSLINRGHTWQSVVDAVNLTAELGIPVGLHFIMGLPGEDYDIMMATVDAVNRLPVDVVKFHQLQVVTGTPLARMVEEEQLAVRHFSVDEYVELCCDIVRRLRPDIAIDRFVSQSPGDMLISPRWGLKNYQFTNLLHARLKIIGTEV